MFDPHGDLAQSIASECKPNIYWDVADPACPYGYNPLTYVTPAYRPLVASGLIDAFKKQWADAWGNRMEHLLRFALLTLLERPNSDLLDIMPLFLDKGFRTEVLANVADPQLLHFWEAEYTAMNFKNAADGVAPIANKLGAFLERLTDALIDRYIDTDTYNQRRQSLLLDQKRLEEDIARMQQAQGSAERVRAFLELVKTLARLYETLKRPEKRNLVEIALSNRQIRGKFPEFEPSDWLLPVSGIVSASNGDEIISFARTYFTNNSD